MHVYARAVHAAITVDRLTKRYGVHAAVDGISFEVARGEVVGFLGPNGAGKSTTLRILAGFLGATSGRALIDGHDVAGESDRARRAMGYMPEAVPLYGEMRVREYLRFRAELKDVPRRKRADAVGRAMELAHVTDVADTLVEHLSKGYRQRVGLADALVASPPVLILDEPTAGMDPNQIRDVRALVKGLGGEHTVLLSTHILPEVEATCGRVLVVDKGRLVAEGKPGDLARAARASGRLVVVVRGDRSVAEEAIRGVSGGRIDSVVEEAEALRFVVEGDGLEIAARAERVVAALARAGVAVREVAPEKTSLEDVFATLTSQDGSPEAAPEPSHETEGAAP